MSIQTIKRLKNRYFNYKIGEFAKGKTPQNFIDWAFEQIENSKKMGIIIY